MGALRNLRLLMRYGAWADDKIFSAVAALPEGEATRERPAVFRNIVHTLNHGLVIDRIWQAHLEGRPHGYTARNTATHPPLEELWPLQREIDAWYVGYADRLSEAAADEVVRFTFVGGGEGSMTRADILMHVVNHKTYHRGHVADMMMQVPARAPATDLPVFLRDVPLELS